MTLGSFLLGLILVTLIVLVRRVNNAEENEEWVDDAFEDEFEDADEGDNLDDDDTILSDTSHNQTPSPDKTIDLSPERKASLAAQAAEVGVMQAAPGSVQGESGWYVDVSEEIQFWNVGADGSWTKVK
jgi:hypothetical protein